MQETDAVINARREMEICNACRYCEGFCAVFPAVELRREFSAGDISYLANLCHGCRGCYYACQYSPPHEWGINVPAALAEVRAESYAEYAWPKPLASMFNRNGTVVSLIAALGIAVVLILSMLLNSPGNFFGAHGTMPDSFYDIIPLWAMQIVAIATFGFSLVALGMGARNFWRDAGPREKIGPAAIGIAFAQLIEADNAAQLRGSAEANRALMRCMTHPDPEAQLVSVLSQRLKASVRLLGAEGQVRHEVSLAETADLDEDRKSELFEKAASGANNQQFAMHREDSLVDLAFPIRASTPSGGRAPLLLVSRSRLSLLERMISSICGSIAAYWRSAPFMNIMAEPGSPSAISIALDAVLT